MTVSTFLWLAWLPLAVQGEYSMRKRTRPFASSSVFQAAFAC